MTVHCLKGCGKSWERHPAVEVECPSCKAGVGSPCKRPSGHKATKHHKDRVLLAYDENHFGECPWRCCRPDERPYPEEKEEKPEQMALFADQPEPKRSAHHG